MTIPNLADFLNFELRQRSIALNQNALYQDGDYVLVWLQQTIRGRDNPVIDAALALAGKLNKPVLVYHGVRSDYPYASDRLHGFLIGASKQMALDLEARDIAHCHYIERPGSQERGLVYKLAEQAVAIFSDEHFTFVGKVQLESFAQKTKRLVVAVDAARLVPTRILPKGLNATKAFRAAHSPLRADWLALREELPVATSKYTGPLCFKSLPLHKLTPAEINTIIASCPINHDLGLSKDHLPEQAVLESRLCNLRDNIIDNYRAHRNNPASDKGSSLLSPYLHFGMTSPWEVMQYAEGSGASRSVLWKFYDELLTWREWAHWRMYSNRGFENYESLQKSTKATLDGHASDPREVILSREQIIIGDTPDPTWNAAQRYWRHTGWLHNNLRMYWAKQILRWTKTPEEAWDIACGLNDEQSLDGRDPATYVSMRWAFGEAKPSYRENPIYGWVAKRSDGALLKRPGFKNWRDEALKLQSI